MKKKALVFILFALPLLGQEQLTLEHARELAIKNNHSLQAVKEASKSTASEKKAAFTYFLPSVQAAGTVEHMNKPFVYETPDLAFPIADAEGNIIVLTDGTGHPILNAQNEPIVKNWAVIPSQKLTFGEDPASLYSLSLTQPIFTGGKLVYQFKARSAINRAAEALLDKTRADIILKTDESYWRVVELTEKVTLAEKYLHLINQHLEDLTNMEEEGLITRHLVLKTIVKKNEAQLMLLKAQNGLHLSQIALNQTLGLPLEEALVLADSPNAAQSDTLTVLQRPELAMANEAVNLASAETGLQRSRYFPNLVAYVQNTWMNPNPWNSLQKEFGSNWSVGLVMQWDIFHWNERGFQLSAAKSRRKAAKHQLMETEALIQLETNQARYKLQEATERITMAQAALDAANENLMITQEQFKEGIASNAEVLEAQTLWQQAYCEDIEARIAKCLASSELEKALGLIGKEK